MQCLAMEPGGRDLYSVLEGRAEDGSGPLPALHCLKVSWVRSTGSSALSQGE